MCALEDQLNNRKTQDDSVFLRIDQSLVDVREEDQEIFNKYVESFLPDEIFDAHISTILFLVHQAVHPPSMMRF